MASSPPPKSKPSSSSQSSGPKKPTPKHAPAQPTQAPPAPPPQLGPKPGQGIDPRMAMIQGMGDLGSSPFGPPPPPPPGDPIGPGGLPFGGSLPSENPGMSPNMDGSSLFQALNMALDPFASPPSGHGDLDPPPDINTLLGMLSLMRSGLPPNMEQASGLQPEPTNPGQTIGLNQFQVTQ